MIFKCPNCNASKDYSAYWEGKSVQCENCGHFIDIPRPKAIQENNQPQTTRTFPEHLYISIIKFDMPFWNIVWMMVKISFAAIPAMIIIGTAWFLIATFILGRASGKF